MDMYYTSVPASKKTFSGLAIRFHPSLARELEISHPTTLSNPPEII